MDKPTVSVGDIFTKAEIAKAAKLFKQCEKSGERFSARCSAEIVEPIMPRINKTTGQENVPLYMAYVLEYAIRFGDRLKDELLGRTSL